MSRGSMGATVNVVRRGSVLASRVEVGTPRQLQKTATALLGKHSGDAVTICRNGRTLCARTRDTAGNLGRWEWTTEGRAVCQK